LKVPILSAPNQPQTKYVNWEDVKKVLGDRYQEFAQAFEFKTTFIHGPYASDAERILQRMKV